MMMKKALVVGMISLLVGMSFFPCMGTVVPKIPEEAAMQKTRFAPWEMLSVYGFQPQQELLLRDVSPGINFPRSGEVFRVGDVIEINGTTSVEDFQNYSLAWGIGLSPTDWSTDGVTLIENGTMGFINETIGFWDTGMVTDAGYYTIQLVVYLLGSGQYNVTVCVYLDPTIHLNFPFGWPEEIQGSQVAIWSPIALSDLNLDGDQEIGFGTVTVVSAGDNNYEYVLDHEGTVPPGWPKQIYSIQGSSLTFSNIETVSNADEVIGGMWGDKIYAWHGDGTLVPGWPKTIAAARSSAAVIDLDRDGDLEIIVPSTDGGGKIYAVHHNATMVAGWPVTIGSPLRSAVATADIDKDGYPEIICGDQDGYVHALHYNGSVVVGWPQLAHDFIKSSPVIADLEGDGDLEIIVCSGFTQQRIVSAWHHDGTIVDGWPVENGLAFAQPSVADLDGDGALEVLCGGAIANTPYGRFYVWHHDGTLVADWPITFPWDGSQNLDYIYAQAVVGDIDGDTDMEIIVGSYYKKLYAWHDDASNVTGWPKIIGDAVDSTAAIADIDQDTLVEIAVAGDDGKIYVWDLPSVYNASHMQWPLFQYDCHHTGCYGGDIIVNQPPDAPTISGPMSARIRRAVDYNFTTSDPNGDEVFYFIDWGDDTNSSWVGPSASGETLIQSHTWAKRGTYTITAKARDCEGAESEWGSLTVTMPASFDRPFFMERLIQVLERIMERFPHAFPILHQFV